MPSLVARCRTALARNRWAKLLWALAIVGLLLGGVPRLEQHTHVVLDPAHHHGPLDDHGHDSDQSIDPDTDADLVLTHWHAAPTLSFAMPNPVVPNLAGLDHRSPDLPFLDLSVPAQGWPPPHRPPIA